MQVGVWTAWVRMSCTLVTSLIGACHRNLRQEFCDWIPSRGCTQVAPEQGRFMAWLIETLGVRRAIEVGVFTGYRCSIIHQINQHHKASSNWVRVHVS